MLAESEALAERIGDGQRLAEVRAARGATTPAPVAAALVADGRFWIIRFGRESARLRTTKGLRHLAELIEHPHVERHVMDLVDLVEGAAARRRGSAPARG